MRLNEIPAEELLRRPEFALLDVRAEIEFAEGHVPGSVNLPILTTPERHEVGTVYKTQGPAAAVALGHRLVDPVRPERVRAWREALSRHASPTLTCFRGGMRSQLAQAWIEESGMPVTRVKGGYKELRRTLFREWEKPLRGFVITGLTGSNKTGFLRSLASPRAIDLEALAAHRGSAFGGLFQPTPQPSQQTFENAVALRLFQNRERGHFLFEDESRLVGRRVIPKPLFESLRTLPRLFLEVSEAERAEHIYREYVATPIETYGAAAVENPLAEALRSLRNRLGGQLTDELTAALRNAFAQNDPDQHRAWIARLLRDYYDRLYAHAMARQENAPVLRGSAAECREWLRRHSDLNPPY